MSELHNKMELLIFEGKSDEGFLVGYSLNSKAFRVYNLETKRVEENLHINFLENKPNVAGKGPNWLFDLDYLTDSMNYQPVRSENQAKQNVDQEDKSFGKELERLKRQEKEANDAAEVLRKEFAQSTEDLLLQAGAARATNPKSIVQTRSKVNKSSGAHAFVSYSQKQRRNNHKDFQHCLFACFLSQNEPKKISKALEDKSWIDAMQEELLQFKIQKVWILVDLPHGKKAIGTKWVYRNKKDERGVVVRNKARLVAQGHRQEEGIDYDEVFSPVVRIEAIRIFLAFASYMGFIVYQMDVKSAFLYGTIDEEVYVSQPPGFVDPKCPQKVYKVVKALYGLHQAPRAWYATLSTFLLKSGYRRGTIDKTLFIKKDKNDIMFQVTPKTSHLNDVKRIFRYLKGKPKLGLWYPRVSSFEPEAYSDSDYARANLDRKSTTGGCQFLGRRLISSSAKKRQFVGTLTIEAEYVVVANSCGQVLWIQNQMLDYGFNFMNTKIYIDNKSTICIVKNPVFHSKTKHIKIRHHFIRDAYEKNRIQVLKIYTDDNVANFLTKAFDVSSEENTEFHQIVDFLSICSINYALTVSPTIYVSYIEQFWNTATSKTINSVKQIHAIVNDRAVVILETSVRNDLLFDDEDGITCLTNDEIFENLALMGYEQLSTKLTFQKGSFSPQWKFLIHTILHCISSKSTTWNEFSTNLASAVICLAKGQKFNFSKLIFDGMLRNLDHKKFLMYPRFLQLFLNNQLKDLPEPFNDTYETPCHTKKVFTNMARKGVKFSGKVTPLFDSMLVPHQAPEGEGSEQPTEPQPTPSPTHPITRDQPPVTNSSSSHDTTQDSRDSLEDINGSEGTQLFVLFTNLSNRVLALETSKDAQAAEILKLKDQIKKLKRKCKRSISHHRAWLKSVKRLSMKKRLGRKEYVSKQGRNNAKPEPTLDAFDDLDADGRDYMETKDVVKEGRQSNETEELNKGSGDKGGSTEELVSTAVPKTMKEEKAKEKGVSIKDIEDSSRPARSILTLKPLPTIDPKDKGKSVLEEPEPAKKMTRSDFDAAQIARDAEIAKQLQVDLQVDVKRERQREEEASKAAIAETYDEVQAGIDADALFAAKLQQEEREEYTIKERSKFLAKTIAAQRKFRATQRSTEIRSRPPTKSQLRNLMMTYLKNMGGYKHSQLKAKTFAEIQGLYERQKRVIDDFKPMDSDDAVKDSKEAAGVNKQEVFKEPNSRRIKMKATKKSKRQKTDADLEEEEQLKAYLKIVPDEERIIDYEVLEKRFPIINWESKFYDFDRHGIECIYYKVFISDGSSRWIKIFSEMVKRFDRLDLVELYNLVMKRFETTTPEGVDLVL
ncbi:putative ribonuclease H-like domain-containing protein [Tanacetum coccineum]